MSHRHRTTARGILLLLTSAALACAAAGTAPAAVDGPAPIRPVPRLIFPVVGAATFTRDFGDARGQGSHQGNDIMAPKRALAVAVEAGKVKFWRTSARAGCMLYLYGASGTTYLYIHLNNDLTLGNDNTGSCVPGVAFARGLVDGAAVVAGQPIAYVGDSGDADGGSPHLHFEVHPGDGAAVDPYSHLRAARRLLFAAEPGTPFTLSLSGTVVQANDGSLELDVASLRRYPGGLKVTKVGRRVELAVPPDTVVMNPLGALIAAAKLAAASPGRPATVWTIRDVATLQAQLGLPLLLAAEKIQLKP